MTNYLGGVWVNDLYGLRSEINISMFLTKSEKVFDDEIFAEVYFRAIADTLEIPGSTKITRGSLRIDYNLV